ncbi:MAG TPA: VOC family protein [Acidimicrobiales bacterium]|jgi:predicted enzyme related to lactoylglutathione lyase|nr:VOC family protein [Acidimicrobiales bacterium]
MPLNLNNIMLGSEDSRRLADFYSKVLGAPDPDWSDEANGWFGFQAGDGSLAIGPHSEVKGKNQQPGRIMLNFSTADVRSEFDRIKDLGAEVVAEPYEPGGASGMLLCTFADPDGNYLQLATPMGPEST